MRFLIAGVLALALAACSAPSGPGAGGAVATDEYFYPPTNGLRYVYAQDNSNAPTADTSMYQVVVGSSYGSYAKLVVNTDSTQGGTVLYYYKVDESQSGVKCILSRNGSDQGIIALEGNLDVGSTWTANSSGTITATVVGHYADYFLPGRQQVYHDVVAVKYVDRTVTDSSYILRMFAKDFGLILEQTVTSQTTETSNLQLLDRLSAANSSGPPAGHGHWYDERGHYMIAVNPDDPNYK